MVQAVISIRPGGKAQQAAQQGVAADATGVVGEGDCRGSRTPEIQRSGDAATHAQAVPGAGQPQAQGAGITQLCHGFCSCPLSPLGSSPARRFVIGEDFPRLLVEVIVLAAVDGP